MTVYPFSNLGREEDTLQGAISAALQLGNNDARSEVTRGLMMSSIRNLPTRRGDASGIGQEAVHLQAQREAQLRANLKEILDGPRRDCSGRSNGNRLPPE